MLLPLFATSSQCPNGLLDDGYSGCLVGRARQHMYGCNHPASPLFGCMCLPLGRQQHARWSVSWLSLCTACAAMLHALCTCRGRVCPFALAMRSAKSGSSSSSVTHMTCLLCPMRNGLQCLEPWPLQHTRRRLLACITVSLFTTGVHGRVGQWNKDCRAVSVARRRCER